MEERARERRAREEREEQERQLAREEAIREQRKREKEVCSKQSTQRCLWWSYRTLSCKQTVLSWRELKEGCQKMNY